MNNKELRANLHAQKEYWQIRQAHYLDLLGLIVPLVAPLVPAYLTGAAIIEHYPGLLHIEKGYVIVMAFIAATVIEVLGILSIETMFDMRNHNATLAEGGEPAPVGAATGAVVFYLALVIALVLVLKMIEGFALWSLVPLTILGFVTSWVMVLRKQHTERVFKADDLNTEQDQIDQLNEQIQRLITEHAEQIDRLNTEHARALQNEHDHLLSVQAELNGLKERFDRLLEQKPVIVQSPKPRAKAARQKVDPERIRQYFVMNPGATVRKAAHDLSYSIGSINEHKPAAPILNGHGMNTKGNEQ